MDGTGLDQHGDAVQEIHQIGKAVLHGEGREIPRCCLCGHELGALAVGHDEAHLICPIHGTRGTMHLRTPRCQECGENYRPVISQEYDGPK